MFSIKFLPYEVHYYCSDVSLEIRQLREQQKKLAASSARVEELLQTLAANKENSSPQTAVPRKLSVSLVISAYTYVIALVVDFAGIGQRCLQ